MWSPAAKAVTPVVRTPAPVPVTPAPQVTTSTKLPKDLAGAKPRYSISQDTYLPRFDSDFDLAAYIVTQTKKSDSDADYLKWAVERSGMTPEEVRKHGLQVRAELKKLAAKSNVDPCGEAGEFHTFVYDGPLFQKPVSIGKTDIVARDGYLFLDILEFSLG